MTEDQKARALEKAKEMFRNEFETKRKRAVRTLANINSFKPNPFLHKYLAESVWGNCEPENLAKALIYPRVLGTSVATSFGSFIQKYCCSDIFAEINGAEPADAAGLDITFVDMIDSRKKHCQLKSGPQTINSGDADQIVEKLNEARRKLLTNGGSPVPEDYIVCVVYGSESDLSANYQRIATNDHPVYIGKEFWKRFTGDEGFYDDLIATFVELAEESTMNDLVDEAVQSLAASFE